MIRFASRYMKTFYVPYKGKKPAALSINGHTLVILFRDRHSVEQVMSRVGATKIHKVRGGTNEVEEAQALQHIGTLANGGVVIAPPDAPFDDVIRSLESELPWLQ